jgi:hypothetical protein
VTDNRVQRSHRGGRGEGRVTALAGSA